MKLLDYGFGSYEKVSLCQEGESCGNISVLKGNVDFVETKTAKSLWALVKKGDESAVTKEERLYESLTAPFEAGEKAGEAVYFVNGNEAGRVDIVSCSPAEKAGIDDNMRKILKSWVA